MIRILLIGVQLFRVNIDRDVEKGCEALGMDIVVLIF